MDFSSVKFPAQISDPLAKGTLAFIILLIICTVIASYLPKTIPPNFRGIIGLMIITILLIATSKLWPYIPVLF